MIEFIDRNDHFFLNLSMPAGKAMLEPAEGVAGSTIVTVMARNGTDFGMRMAGMPERWFTAPAGLVQGLYFPQFQRKRRQPGYRRQHGDRDRRLRRDGDGGRAGDRQVRRRHARNWRSRRPWRCTRSRSTSTSSSPSRRLNFRGTPCGIDVRKVIETGILPQINTGIAHKDPGVGMVGAGILRAPEKCFRGCIRGDSEKL